MTERKTDEEIGEQFAADLSTFCTSYSRQPKEFAVAKMLKDHRTCQQSMMRFFMQFVEKLAESGSDLRNEASVELAKAIMEIDSKKRILPYI
jgi:hypothetical protein